MFRIHGVIAYGCAASFIIIFLPCFPGAEEVNDHLSETIHNGSIKVCWVQRSLTPRLSAPVEQVAMGSGWLESSSLRVLAFKCLKVMQEQLDLHLMVHTELFCADATILEFVFLFCVWTCSCKPAEKWTLNWRLEVHLKSSCEDVTF